MIKLNANTILALLASLGVFAPDIASFASLLAGLHISWLGYVVRALGLLAAFCAAAPLIVPKLRPLLALLGLATPPGATAPWIPGRPGDPQAVQPVSNLGAIGDRLDDTKVFPSGEAPTPVQGVRLVRPKDGGAIPLGLASILFWGSMLGLAAAAAFILATPRKARADGDHPATPGTAIDGDHPAPQAIGCFDKGNLWCVVPAAAVGWQLNLKSGAVANGVGLGGLVLQHQVGSLPLGAGLYFGLGASTSNQSSYQGCIGVSVTNFGLVCLGAQRATFQDGSTAYQGMLTFAGQLVFGGTPSYVSSVAQGKPAQ